MDQTTFTAVAIVILLFSIIVHEVMHGLVALKFGDHTAKDAGRLTLNPLPHVDPLGTILVPAILILSGLFLPNGNSFIIGWAKPVPINPFNFTNIRKGELFVSLAGVGSNFALAILAAAIYHLFILLLPQIILELLEFTVTINLILGVFNLLPIPPLDGSKVLMSRLSTKLAIQYQSIERYGMFIIFFLLFFPIAGVPILSLIMGIIINTINLILRVPLRLF